MSKTVQQKTLVEYRYSKGFWIKKILLLAGCVLVVWLSWWLWRWDPNPVVEDSRSIVDTDLDGINDKVDVDDDDDGFSDKTEIKEGSDPLDKNSVPASLGSDGEEDEEDAVEDVDSSEDTAQTGDQNSIYELFESSKFSVQAPTELGEPTEFNGCSYEFESQEAGVLTLINIGYECEELDELNELKYDLLWKHSTDSSGQVTSVSSPTELCQSDGTSTNCAPDNGQLEILSIEDSGSEISNTGFYIYFISADESLTSEEASEYLLPVINSIKAAAL